MKWRIHAATQRGATSNEATILITLATSFPNGGCTLPRPKLERGADATRHFCRRLPTSRRTLGHGPQLLLTAEVYKNHKMTRWTTVRGDLEKAGATVEDKEVVVDKNLVTSRQPEDIPAFVKESLALLSGGTQSFETQRVAP